MKIIASKIAGTLLGFLLIVGIPFLYYALNSTLIFNRIAYGLLFLILLAETLLSLLLIYLAKRGRFTSFFFGWLIALLPSIILINFWFPKSGSTKMKEAIIQKEYYQPNHQYIIDVRLADNEIYIRNIDKHTREEWGVGTIVMVPISEGCMGWAFFEDDIEPQKK